MENCIYRFLDEYENIIYIGKAKNLYKRLESHKHLPEECYLERAYIDYACFENEYEMDFAERYYIQKLRPKYNSQLANKPISFTSKELDNMKFTRYETTPYIVEKSKEQMEEFKNENLKSETIYFKLDIDIFDFMATHYLLSLKEYKSIKDNKLDMEREIKNYEKYKYIKDNVIDILGNEIKVFRKKYNLLEFDLAFLKISANPVSLKNNTIEMYLKVKEKYTESFKFFRIYIECK